MKVFIGIFLPGALLYCTFVVLNNYGVYKPEVEVPKEVVTTRDCIDMIDEYSWGHAPRRYIVSGLLSKHEPCVVYEMLYELE